MLSGIEIFIFFVSDHLKHDYHRVLSFISYSLVIVLHSESFENNLFKLDLSISENTCFYCQIFSGR